MPKLAPSAPAPRGLKCACRSHTNHSRLELERRLPYFQSICRAVNSQIKGPSFPPTSGASKAPIKFKERHALQEYSKFGQYQHICTFGNAFMVDTLIKRMHSEGPVGRKGTSIESRC